MTKVAGPYEPINPDAVWTPGPKVVQPNGEPLPADMDFFAPPPPEVGEVLVAYSTLKVGKSPRSTPMIWLNVACAAGLVFFAAVYLIPAIGMWRADETGPILITAGVLAAVAGLGVFLLVGRSHRASYVGRAGVADLYAKGSITNLKAATLLRFADASDLRTGQTRQYYNGVYTGTSYHFRWTNLEGKKVATLGGRFRSAKGTPKAKSPYWTAFAGERAWTMHVMPLIAEAFETDDFADFRLLRERVIRLGPGYFEFHFGGEPQRVEREDIKTLQLGQGAFRIRTHEAKTFGKAGKFDFTYAELGNASAFLNCMADLTGFEFN